MARCSNRDKILTEGLRVVHERGFAGASVRDIVQAAGVPQGSFTNHFTSKEAFGLEIIELYLARSREVRQDTLLNPSLPPLERLAAYIDASIMRQDPSCLRSGCLFGNFTAEASEHSEAIRARLVEIFAELRAEIASCLAAAVASGDLPEGFDCEDVAGFVLASLEGAVLLAKAERSPEPLERFKRILFSHVLR